jgi:hypothetical protein
MKGSVELDLLPFQIPNFAQVKRSSDADDGYSIPIKALGDEVFHALVNEWVDEIYKKAGKRQPPICVPA